jgi:alpha-L-rhamnosidase
MTGYPGIPDLDTIEGVVVRSAVEKAGFFRCSDALINRVHDTVLWTLESNLHGLPTDCPHRERAGWLGDAHVTVEATLYNYQMSQFWQKFIRDIETTSDLKGGLPAAVAPGKRRVGKPPDWGVATVLLPWTCYLFYDDIRFLENHYTYMQRFLEYFYSLSEDWIVEAGLGDWCDPVAHAGAERIGGGGRPQNTRPALTSTAYFFFSANIMDQVATLLGKAEESQLYRAWAQQIKIRFNEVFYDENSADYGSQTADAIALYMGLVPEGDEPKVAHSLAKDVTEKWQGHYSTGSHGITRLFWALQKYGFEDVAFNIFHAQGFPGFPYLFAMGGTTLWERMGSFNPDEIAPDRSLSHPFHGGFDAWFFQGVAGIELDPRFPGFKHFFLKPGLLGQLYFAEAEYESPYGSIRSSWRIEDETFVWNLRVPANTKATVYVPAENCESVTESGQPAEDAPGIKFLRMENGFAVYLLGSGEYSFFAPTYANH